MYGSEVLFDGTDTNSADNLWVTNGTVAGTSELSVDGTYSQAGTYGGINGLNPTDLTVFDGKVLLNGEDTGGSFNLWVTNGTKTGTSELTLSGQLLPTGNPDSPGGLDPTDLTVFGSEVLFSGEGTDFYHNLWVVTGTDGSGASELSVNGANTGLGKTGLKPSDLTVFGSEVLFSGYDNTDFSPNLWITDGTGPGTSELIANGQQSDGLEPQYLTVFGSEALFNGLDTNDDKNLWVTNGTVGGTSELSVKDAASNGLDPSNFFVFGSEVLFNGEDTKGDDGLWVTNGTAAGTSELSVSGAEPTGLAPFDFILFDGGVRFFGLNTAGEYGLWMTDGTATGTKQVFQLPSGLLLPFDLTSFVTSTQSASPAITGVTSQITSGPTPNEGYAVSGDTVEIDIALSDSPLVVTGSGPVLKLGSLVTTYVSTQTDLNNGILAFDYTVAKNQNLTALQISSLTLGNGVTVTDTAGNAANLTLTTAEKALGISADGVVPTVESITVSPSRGPVAEGTTVSFTLRVSEDVEVTGTPTLALSDGEVASYVSGTGTTSLVFQYKVGAETTSDLKITGINQSAGNGIADVAGNALSSVLSDDLKLQIGVPPTPAITGITAHVASGPTPNTGFAISGDTVEIDVALSDSPLVVTGGDPILKLGTLVTTYVSTQSDLNNGILAFDYTVAKNQKLTALKVSSLTLPKGGTVTDEAGNAANLALTAAEENLGISADGVVPAVQSVTVSPSRGPVAEGTTIAFTLKLSEAATVTGAPTLALSDGEVASYVSGTGTTSLVFHYTVGAETTSDLKITGIDQSAGNTITDLAGNALSSVLSKDLKLQIGVPPTPAITGITAHVTGGPTPNTGYAIAGDTVEIDIALSDSPLVVTGGSPILKLGTLSTTYASTQTDLTNGILAFDYTVAENQKLTALKVSSLTLPKGVTITDQSGNPANLKLTPAEEALGISADGVTPKVDSAKAASSSKTIVNGDTVTITLAMSEAVTVTGTPSLTLSDGASASYSTGSGPKSLVFTYNVGAETSTDLKITAIDETGAGITDVAGNSLSSAYGADLKLKINPPPAAKPLDAGLALFVNAIAGFAPAGGHGDAAVAPATSDRHATDLAQPHG